MGKIQIKKEWLQESGKYKCPYCNKDFHKNGIGTHIYRNHTEEGKKHNPNKGYENGTRTVWNKGKKFSQSTKEKISKSLTGRKLSKEHRQNLSIALKNSTIVGGCRKGSGIGKSGWYKNYWCDSSWELAFVIYNLEHNIPFKRNTEKFSYQFKGQNFNYYPDFIINNNEYIEIKNFDTEKTIAKYKYFPYKLTILYGEHMEKYLTYVINKYGNDFYRLYDNNIIDIYNLPCQVDYDYLNLQININPLIDKILNSGIDFSKFGWVGKVSIILNKKPQKVNQWMKKYMPEFYENNCFKRKVVERK